MSPDPSSPEPTSMPESGMEADMLAELSALDAPHIHRTGDPESEAVSEALAHEPVFDTPGAEDHELTQMAQSQEDTREAIDPREAVVGVSTEPTPLPLWLMDVDGVLNAIAAAPDRSAWEQWSRGDATDSAGRTFPILFAPALLARLRELHESGAVEIQWLTTWAHDANTALSELLGLPQLRVAGAPPSHRVLIGEPTDPDQDAAAPRAHADVGGAHAADALTGHWWKFDAVRTLLEEDPLRPIIWTDDDLRWEPEVVAWVRAHANALVLAPRTRLGLTPKQLRAIEAFIHAPVPANLTDLNGSPLSEATVALDAI